MDYIKGRVSGLYKGTQVCGLYKGDGLVEWII